MKEPKPNRGGGRFWSSTAYAEAMGVSRSTVWRWATEGKIPSVRTQGGQLRIPATSDGGK